MTTQVSFQTQRVETKLQRYVKETLDVCWYHLTDKALVLNQDVITKVSKLMFVVQKLIDKPVDDYVKTFTGNDANVSPEPDEG